MDFKNAKIFAIFFLLRNKERKKFYIIFNSAHFWILKSSCSRIFWYLTQFIHEIFSVYRCEVCEKSIRKLSLSSDWLYWEIRWLTLLREALVFKYQLLFKTVLHDDALSKYFPKNLIWVTNCMTILFELKKKFKITMKMEKNE